MYSLEGLIVANENVDGNIEEMNSVEGTVYLGDGVAFSPTVEVEKEGKETTITITDINGEHVATIFDGESGVYVGSGEVPEGYNVQIDPEGTPEFVAGSGVTKQQAESLWAILQKTAFVDILTEEEINTFKTAWLFSNEGDSSDPEEGGTDEEEQNPEIILGESTTCLVASWLSGIPVTTVVVEYADEVENVNGEIKLAGEIYNGSFYTTGNENGTTQQNYYESLLGKYVVSFAGDIYYIDPESTYNHDTNVSDLVSERIVYNKAYRVYVAEQGV